MAEQARAFVKIPLDIVRDMPQLSSSAFRVYATILSYDWETNDNACTASNSTLAKHTGLDRGTVTKALEDLETAGLIDVTYRKGMSSIIRVKRGKMLTSSPAGKSDMRENPAGEPAGKSRNTCGEIQQGVLENPATPAGKSRTKQIQETDSGKQIHEPPSDARDAKATFRADGLSDEEAPTFDEFWRVYPVKDYPAIARRHWDDLSFAARRNALKAAYEFAEVWRSASGERKQYCPAAAKWLEGHGWEGDRDVWKRRAAGGEAPNTATPKLTGGMQDPTSDSITYY